MKLKEGGGTSEVLRRNMNRIKIHCMIEWNSQRINKKSTWKNSNVNKPMRLQHDVMDKLCSFTACHHVGNSSISQGADNPSQVSIGDSELYTPPVLWSAFCYGLFFHAGKKGIQRLWLAVEWEILLAEPMILLRWAQFPLWEPDSSHNSLGA